MRGYLGLGSNVGDPLANLRAAADRLPVVARSSVYETEPQGEVTDQPDFLNAAVQIETDLDAEALLDLCKRVEAEMGRDFGQVRHGPRVIDIDLLLLGNLEHRSERLTLPHRDVLTRRFVLVPLLELDPALEIPGYGPAARALAALGEGQAVRRAGPPLDVPAQPAVTCRAGSTPPAAPPPGRRPGNGGSA
jgi:2-amino-4-hydroxy-6-hydroxymethyldihydropteridine diphosphokinase